MASFNKVLLMGNLTRDPEMRYLPSNMPVVGMGVAVNRRWKDQKSGEDREETTFVDCNAFGKTAELINQYFHKGDAIFVEGRLKLDQWEDKQGGGKRSKLTVVVENLHFLPRREGGGGGGNYSQEGEQGGGAPRRAPARPAGRPAPQSQQSQQAPAQEPPYDEGQQQFKEDDIPF